ncbi:Cationic amino acid transporter 1 [Apostasia shenzhenica]|uniref:Cationic amino acid transporter 1 n=1 Tax=Apostasia shenzhenica TaxID=1088818 RepID=A0A2I0A9X6_9ASPA|nr:Cationic amino acid transporter 1 [Apostasia shenzhenica]
MHLDPASVWNVRRRQKSERMVAQKEEDGRGDRRVHLDPASKRRLFTCPTSLSEDPPENYKLDPSPPLHSCLPSPTASSRGSAPPPPAGDPPEGKKRGIKIDRSNSYKMAEGKSFESLGSYGRALMQTGSRLMDRVTARSLEDAEINEMRARSGCEMKRNLSWWDLIWFGIGAVIGAGIFVLTGQEAKESAGPAVVLSFVVSGVSAMLSVFCYTEFAVEIPVAGGSFAYLRVELGDFMAFIAGGNILLEYVIGSAAVARAWTSYLATLFNSRPDNFRLHVASLPEDYSQLDPIAVAVIVGVCVAAVMSTKATSRFNSVASIIHVVILLFIIVAGLLHADPANLKNFTPFGSRGIFSSAAVLFFAYVGFDAVSTMAEETKNPARDIPLGLVGAMSITTAAYCLLALTLCLMVPYQKIDPNAPFSVAFESVGMDWAKYIVSFGALKGMTTVLLVSSVGMARYLTHIARTHMVPSFFADVNPKTGTPVKATVAMLTATAVIALFTDLPILANLLSIATLFIFMLVAVALLVRRYYASGETTPAARNKLAACLATIIGSSVVAAVLWATNVSGWGWYAAVAVAWGAATGYLWVGVPQARKPKVWGVPMVPWLPAMSVLINVFLLGSIDGKSYVRFSVWTGLLLLYYFFFGLHASYDMARVPVMKTTALEEGSKG